MAIDYQKDGRIAIFTINRPTSSNALDVEAIHQLHEAMVDFRDNPELWVGILTGAGEKAFCCGADVKELFSFSIEHPGELQAVPATPMRGLELWKPLIAAINGVALGGGLEITLACDIRVASESSKFGTPEVTLGLIPGWGGTQRLPRMLPKCKAAEMLLMGKIIDAKEAYRIGLVNAVVSQNAVMRKSKEWAEVICKAAPLSVRAAKEAMVKGASMPLEDGLKLEMSLQRYLMGTGDYRDGIAAFVQKRRPVYKGK